MAANLFIISFFQFNRVSLLAKNHFYCSIWHFNN
jgi:hypothetical protein